VVQLKSEYSDPTGWGSTPAEIGYSVSISLLALYCLLRVIENLKKKLSMGKVVIDTLSESVSEAKEEKLAYEIVKTPLEFEIVGTEPTMLSYKVEDNVYLIKLSFNSRERVAEFVLFLKSN